MHGTYLSANGQLAARAIGSEVGFVKSYLTAQLFHPVPGMRRVVLATSARVGLAMLSIDGQLARPGASIDALTRATVDRVWDGIAAPAAAA